MIKPAQQYLTLRSIGAPAVLLSLALQGIFRGFKDTKTPFYATSKKEILSPVTFVVRLIKFLLGFCSVVRHSVIHDYAFEHPKERNCFIKLYHTVVFSVF